MRNKVLALTLTTLLLPSFDFAHAQDPAQNGSQPASNSSNNGPESSTKQTGGDAAGQPSSLAEMARLARAKKQGDGAAKPAAKVVLDDDNMPRGVYAADAPAAGAKAGATAGSAAATSGGPFPEFRGKVVLLDFWASWCGPCRDALPNLKRLQSIYGGDDFVVVSVSEDDDEATWRSFTAEHRMNWPQRFDSDGSVQRQFGVKGLPTYILIGRNGAVVDKVVGEDPARSIMEQIGPALKKSLSAKL